MSNINDHKILVNNLLLRHRSNERGIHRELIETHISSVILIGEFAYKIKKPVDFGFLDFTQLEDRKLYCEEEIRLNARLAPSIYLQAIVITGSIHKPELDGQGAAIEYAVKMRRFDQSCMLDKLIDKGKLDGSMIDDLADQLAHFHKEIKVANENDAFATADKVLKPMQQNFEQIAARRSSPEDRQSLSTLKNWTMSQFKTLQSDLENRRHGGFIRECHGDMHLGNMLLRDQHIIIFDGIEFNEDLRWIDVISELAFVCMDLNARGADVFSARLLNRYLENTGDYGGLKLLRFYLVYRSLVRAKVSTLSVYQPGLNETQRYTLESQYQTYMQLARQYIQAPSPCIYLMYGVSGSGKSTVSSELLQRLGAIRIRSDRERIRQFGNNTATRDKLNEGVYDPAITDKTYLHLLGLTELIFKAGYSVIVDATFLKRTQRQPFQQLAEQFDIPCTVIQLEASLQNLQYRVTSRKHQTGNISDATVKVISHQLAKAEPPTVHERHLQVQTDRDIDYEMLVKSLLAKNVKPAIPGE